MNNFKHNLYALNLPQFQSQIDKNYIRKEKLTYQLCNNCVILPLRKTELNAIDAIYEGGVCDSNFKFISGYNRRDNSNPENFEIIRSYQPKEEIAYSDEEVIFAGIVFEHFGHFIVETFARLWWIVQNNAFDKKVVFLKNGKTEQIFHKLIEYVGIKKENIIFLEKPTQFKKVIIPDQALCYFNYAHPEYTLPYEKIMQSIEPSHHKKIYLSRTQFRKKDCINEEYFEQFYKNQGYHIVYPEQLDITDQIALVSGADEIVSTIGTISHLALFAKKMHV